MPINKYVDYKSKIEFYGFGAEDPPAKPTLQFFMNIPGCKMGCESFYIPPDILASPELRKTKIRAIVKGLGLDGFLCDRLGSELESQVMVASQDYGFDKFNLSVQLQLICDGETETEAADRFFSFTQRINEVMLEARRNCLDKLLQQASRSCYWSLIYYHQQL